MKNRAETIVVVVLTLLMTFMEMTALPAGLFCNVKFRDVNPIYFTLMLNFLQAFGICFLCRKFLLKDWRFGLQTDGLTEGLRKYGFPAVLMTILVTFSFCIGLAPFDNRPTVWRVLIEGVVYYIGVGIMEELYLRGLLQNLLAKWFGKQKNGTLYAIYIASVLFGLGHAFGALGQPLVTIVAKVIWATALGVYFGAVYVVSKNLWVPILLHLVINLCGIPFCFSASNQYPPLALLTCLVSYLLLGIYGVHLMRKYTFGNSFKK